MTSYSLQKCNTSPWILCCKDQTFKESNDTWLFLYLSLLPKLPLPALCSLLFLSLVLTVCDSALYFWSGILHSWMDNYHSKQELDYLFYLILFLYTGKCSWFIPDTLWYSKLDDNGDGSGTKPRCLETSLLLNFKWIGGFNIWTREKYPKSDGTATTYSAIRRIILQFKNVIGKNIFLHTNQLYNWKKIRKQLFLSPSSECFGNI